MAIRTVLLVDDDPDVRRVASVALSRLRPWRVLEAGDAKAGLDLAARERPDLVLLDVTMPGVDGVSLLKSIRTLEGMHETPIIFITAHVLPTRTSQLVGLGATGVITKPFVAKHLPAQIEALVEGVTVRAPAAGDKPADMATADVMAALAEAREAFARELPGKLDALGAALAKLQPGEDGGEALEDARIRAHKLAGSAGTHGLTAVSRAARRIEDVLLAVRAEGGPPDARSLDEVARALAEARSSA